MALTADALLRRFMLKAKLRHLQVLMKLAELGSMRRAAQDLNMTQPAVSQLVAEMEQLMETKLFVRHARGATPTEAAQDLLFAARRIREALQDGSEAIASRLNENSGVVRIYATPAAIGGILYGRLGSFSETNPNIVVHVAEAAGDDPLSGIAASTADLVCTREPTVIPEGWLFEELLADELTVLCGADHRLAGASDIPSSELAECKWLMYRVGSPSRQRFESFARAHNFPETARCRLVMHIPELTRGLLLEGNHLAIIPRSVAVPWLQEGTIVELKTELTCRLAPLGIVRRVPGDETREAARLFAHLARLMAPPAP